MNAVADSGGKAAARMAGTSFPSKRQRARALENWVARRQKRRQAAATGEGEGGAQKTAGR